MPSLILPRDLSSPRLHLFFFIVFCPVKRIGVPRGFIHLFMFLVISVLQTHIYSHIKYIHVLVHCLFRKRIYMFDEIEMVDCLLWSQKYFCV
jgi:hypothetical protein